MCFLGPAPALVIALTTIAVAAARQMPAPLLLLHNVASYATLPLVGGLLARLVVDAGVERTESRFALVVFAVYWVTILLSFGLIAATRRLLLGSSIRSQIRTIFVPLMPSEAAAAMLILGFALTYSTSGMIALVVLVLALCAFQGLTSALLTSQERAEQLAVRSTQLASLQVGVLAALVQTLSLRDKMTARHSAAVARYAKAIAGAIGCTEEEQELVHTAGLLHDIGKFIFPDSILFADRRLSDDD